MKKETILEVISEMSQDLNNSLNRSKNDKSISENPHITIGYLQATINQMITRLEILSKK